MCGIIYYKSFTGHAVNRSVLKHYLRQKERGHEGFGFVGVSKRKLMICRATRERKIKKYLKNPYSEILLHHRLPTSTSNTIKTTHPIVVSQPICNNKYYLVHNGIMQNDTELKAKHEKMGIVYQTTQYSQYMTFWGRPENRYEFNDSEALAYEIALFLDGKQKGIEARGDVAFICLETDMSNNALKLHFARNNGSPLEMKRDAEFMVIASENVTNQDIPPNILYSYDYRTQTISQARIELAEYELFGYDDWGADIEGRIVEYENAISEIEEALLEASLKGDIIKQSLLQRKKEQYAELIEELYDEWRYLEDYMGL